MAQAFLPVLVSVGQALACVVATPHLLSAATIDIRSEFLRSDPQGAILSTDQTPHPREILSPAVPRNAYTSFHVVVRSNKPTSYFLFVGSNPPDSFRIMLYKEIFVKRQDEWIPDTLEPVRSPNFEAIPDGGANIPDQTSCSYLLDVWVPPDAPVSRVRIEVQLKEGAWLLHPLEFRVLSARVPSNPAGADVELPAIEERADAAALEPFLRFMGPRGEGPRSAAESANFTAAREKFAAPRNLREVIRRNAEQDMALARTLDPKTTALAMKTKQERSGSGGEWYLAIRDLIYRLSSQP